MVATNIANQGATFSTTDTKLYVPVVTLSTLSFVLKEQLTGINIKQKYQQKE